MKKIFALVLAVAMVLSLASVAMAANTQIGTLGEQALGLDNFTLTLREKKDVYNDVTGEPIPYGETVYIPLKDLDGNAITDSDAVSSLKISAKWTENGKYIKGVEIAKKDGKYFIIIKTTGSEMSDKDVEGTLTLSGKAFAASDTDKKTKIEKTEIDVVLTLEYPETKESEITDDAQIFLFNKEELQDEELELTVEDTDITFTVDTTHQAKLVLSYNDDEVEAVEKANPEANLDFHNFNSATFKKTGTLLIPADEGSYLYEIVDGAVKAVNAKYDDFEEAFILKTKTLGSYVVSDIQLKTGTVVAPAAEAPATANPATGAAL